MSGDGGGSGPPRLDEQLCFALYTASRLVIRAYRPVLEGLGLTYPQYLAMLILWEQEADGAEAPTVTGLGERLYLDSGTLTPLLRRLEEKGLVVRQRDGGDERQVRLRLTEAGRALSGPAACVPERLLAAVGGGGVGAEEVAGLRDMMWEVISRLEGEVRAG